LVERLVVSRNWGLEGLERSGNRGNSLGKM
jgi:hypothetical protein